jgi:alpha-beta hydrolase superfamily lysophospholipase
VSWDPPAPIAVRGTVALLPGRGEHAGVYQRLGSRLAVDGYAVRVLDVPPLGDDPAPVLATLAEQVEKLTADETAPVVLLGSDTGALLALALAGRVPVAGAVAAGLPVDAATEPDGWDAELDARTACPTHRSRLAEDPELRRGALAEPVPDGYRRALAGSAPRVPVLVVHGAADTVTPVAKAAAFGAGLPRARVVTVAGGRHDILNDLHHRSVAAEIVQYLERLRVAPEPADIVVVDPTSRW